MHMAFYGEQHRKWRTAGFRGAARALWVTLLWVVVGGIDLLILPSVLRGWVAVICFCLAGIFACMAGVMYAVLYLDWRDVRRRRRA